MKKILFVLGLVLVPPSLSHADIITFDFTGRLIVQDPNGYIMTNLGNTWTPIAASLTYDTVLGEGNSSLSITMDEAWNGSYATFHDINMTLSGPNTITGSILVDWAGGIDMYHHIEWDAKGLINAITMGLTPGDVISGDRLYHDYNGNGVEDDGEFRGLIGSVMPYSSTLEAAQYGVAIPGPDEGPAPMAATSNTLGLQDGPFPGFRGFFNIGSGESMHVTSVSSVPIPAAVWLFGSGLLGLVGMARRKKSV